MADRDLSLPDPKQHGTAAWLLAAGAALAIWLRNVKSFLAGGADIIRRVSRNEIAIAKSETRHARDVEETQRVKRRVLSLEARILELVTEKESLQHQNATQAIQIELITNRLSAVEAELESVRAEKMKLEEVIVRHGIKVNDNGGA